VIDRPEPTEYASYYNGYVGAVPRGDILELLESRIGRTIGLLGNLGEDKALFRYAAGKWSIKEIVGHLCNTERASGFEFTVRAIPYILAGHEIHHIGVIEAKYLGTP
jgi:hypothetical protein